MRFTRARERQFLVLLRPLFASRNQELTLPVTKPTAHRTKNGMAMAFFRTRESGSQKQWAKQRQRCRWKAFRWRTVPKSGTATARRHSLGRRPGAGGSGPGNFRRSFASVRRATPGGVDGGHAYPGGFGETRRDLRQIE